MNTKRFIARTIVKTISYATITIIMLSLLNSAVITNDIALGQMQNSNEAYVIMGMYDNMKHIISIVYNCITVCFAGTIIYDIYKFIKTKTKEKN